MRQFIIVRKAVPFCWDGWMNGNVFLPLSETDWDKRIAGTIDRCFPLSSLFTYIYIYPSVYTLGGFICCLASLGRIHTAGVSPPNNPPLLHTVTHADAAVVTRCSRCIEPLRSTFTLQGSLKQSCAFTRQTNSTVASVPRQHFSLKVSILNSWGCKSLCECGLAVFIHIYQCLFLLILVLLLYFILYKTNDH